MFDRKKIDTHCKVSPGTKRNNYDYCSNSKKKKKIKMNGVVPHFETIQYKFT